MLYDFRTLGFTSKEEISSVYANIDLVDFNILSQFYEATPEKKDSFERKDVVYLNQILKIREEINTDFKINRIIDINKLVNNDNFDLFSKNFHLLYALNDTNPDVYWNTNETYIKMIFDPETLQVKIKYNIGVISVETTISNPSTTIWGLRFALTKYILSGKIKIIKKNIV